MSISKKKKHNNKGFTLVETVVSLIAVTLLTTLFFTLTSLAKDTYVSVEEASEGQVLASILTNSIQDELRYATNTDYVSAGAISVKLYSNESKTYAAYPDFTYFSKALKLGADCSLVNYKGQVYVVPLYSANKDNIAAAKKQTITGTSSYVFDMRAYVDAFYVPSAKSYYVDLVIVDKDYDTSSVDTALTNHTLTSLSGTLYSTSFTVESLNPNTLY